jgi:hypothetical protein
MNLFISLCLSAQRKEKIITYMSRIEVHNIPGREEQDVQVVAQ